VFGGNNWFTCSKYGSELKPVNSAFPQLPFLFSPSSPSPNALNSFLPSHTNYDRVSLTAMSTSLHDQLEEGADKQSLDELDDTNHVVDTDAGMSRFRHPCHPYLSLLSFLDVDRCYFNPLRPFSNHSGQTGTRSSQG
jgi:hypothetical protein